MREGLNMNREPGVPEQDSVPEHLILLGEIVRETVSTGNLNPLAKFLEKHEIAVSPENLLQFRDLIIVRRLDLRDLADAARMRLRSRLLANEDTSLMSKDYAAYLEVGAVPRCRDCRWFVTAPNDGTPTGDKSCVGMGAKGSDVACIGFTSVQ